MRQAVVAGNWKMNGSRASSQELVQSLLESLAQPACKVILFAPFALLPSLEAMLSGSAIQWGGQTVSEHDAGAYTGEIAGNMLTDVGCSHVLVGHSERRSLFGETSAVVAAKFQQAQAVGLTPILCVGETQAEREAGQTEAVVAEQLDAVLKATGVAALANAIIAYEPVWAIGTGLTATPEQAQDVHAFIRQKLAALDTSVAENVQILYGGSVKAANAKALFAKPDIDGGLVGGASLKADEFVGICEAV